LPASILLHTFWFVPEIMPLTAEPLQDVPWKVVTSTYWKGVEDGTVGALTS